MAGVRLIVVSGNHPISAQIEQLAKTKKVSIINSPGDSAGTAWLIRAAGKIRSVLKTDSKGRIFSAREKLSQVRAYLANLNTLIECVADDDGRLIGVFSKSDLLKSTGRKLILVDHNELTQAVDGAGDAEILEVIDHHRLGNPPTQQPILFINKPVGSTCSIVADLFQTAGLKPAKQIAGILMGGIIADTLNLQSPTTTPRDGELLAWLSEIAGTDAGALANLMFEAGSTLSSGAPDAVITADCKQYDEGKIRFSVSQIEELGFRFFWKKSDAIIDALERYRKANGLFISTLLVTDINTQNSLLLIKGDAGTIRAIGYPAVNEGEIYEMHGVVSRKKQLVPYLVNLLQTTGR